MSLCDERLGLSALVVLAGAVKHALLLPVVNNSPFQGITLLLFSVLLMMSLFWRQFQCSIHLMYTCIYSLY